MKVLIADDSAEIRDRLVSTLSGVAGVEVVAAVSNTFDCVQEFHRQWPDAVVLDFRMPGGGGVRALSEIKRVKPSAFTIMLTAYPYKSYRDRCFEVGGDHFLHKATEFYQVPQLIRRFQDTFGHEGPPPLGRGA